MSFSSHWVSILLANLRANRVDPEKKEEEEKREKKENFPRVTVRMSLADSESHAAAAGLTPLRLPRARSLCGPTKGTPPSRTTLQTI